MYLKRFTCVFHVEYKGGESLNNFPPIEIDSRIITLN